MKLPAKARSLLQDAMYALQDECDAAGPEETEEHPELRDHARIAKSIREYLLKNPK